MSPAPAPANFLRKNAEFYTKNQDVLEEWSNHEGREARSGGYGYLLGDEGGGYSVVRDAVREALREYYAGLEPGTLVVLEVARVHGEPVDGPPWPISRAR